MERIQELETTIAQLKSELLSTKEQLEKALSITPELETLHLTNRKLTAQISETVQKCDNFQSRLKLSQQRCSDLEYKVQRHEENEKKMKERYEQSNVKTTQFTREIEELKAKLSAVEKVLENEQNEKSLFISTFNQQNNENICDLEEIISIVSTLKKPSPVLEPKHDSSVEPVECKACRLLECHSKKHNEVINALEAVNRKLKEDLLKRDQDLMCIDAKFHNESMNQTADAIEDDGKRLSVKIEKLKQSKSKLKSDNETLLMEIDRLKKENKLKDERIEDLRGKLLERPVVERNNELEELLTSQIEALTQEKTHLADEIGQKEIIIKETTGRNRQLTQTLEEVQKAKSGLSRQLKSLRREYDTVTSHYDTRKQEQHAAMTDLKAENSALQNQLETLEKSCLASEAARNEILDELETLKKSQKQLFSILGSQKLEIEHFCKERCHLIDLLQKQNQLIMRLEAISSKTEQQLSQAIERANSAQSVDPMFGVLPSVRQFLVPLLEADVKNQVENALILDSCTPEDRIKQVYDIISSEIRAQKVQIIEKDKVIEAKKTCKECEVLQTALRTAVYGLQKSLTKEISACDPSLAQMIKYHNKRMQDALEKARVIPLKGMLEGSLEKRTSAIQEFEETEDVSPLCGSLVMINIALEEALKQKTTELTELKDVQKLAIDIIGCGESDLVSHLSRMKDANKKLKIKNKSLSEELADSRNNAEKALHNYKNELQERQGKTEVIQNDLNQSLVRNEELESKLKAKEDALETIQNYNKELQQIMETIQASHNEEISQYEETINDRNRELTEMANKVNALMAKVESLGICLKKTESELTGKLVKEQEEHEQEVERLKREFVALHAKQSKKFASKKQQYEEAIAKLTTEIESKDATASSQREASANQITELQSLSQQLKSSCQESESTIKNMQTQLQKVQKVNASLERKLKTVTEHAKREQNIIEAKCSCMIMASETKHHDDIIQLRNELQTKEGKMMIRILNSFKVLDSLEDDEINETVFEETMTRIAQNMGKCLFK